jgi:hypothetical protein
MNINCTYNTTECSEGQIRFSKEVKFCCEKCYAAVKKADWPPWTELSVYDAGGEFPPHISTECECEGCARWFLEHDPTELVELSWSDRKLIGMCLACISISDDIRRALSRVLLPSEVADLPVCDKALQVLLVDLSERLGQVSSMTVGQARTAVICAFRAVAKDKIEQFK